MKPPKAKRVKKFKIEPVTKSQPYHVIHRGMTIQIFNAAQGHKLPEGIPNWAGDFFLFAMLGKEKHGVFADEIVHALAMMRTAIDNHIDIKKPKADDKGSKASAR